MIKSCATTWGLALCCAVLCCAVLCCAMLCYAVLAVPCHAMLCHAMLCYAMPCCAMPPTQRSATLCCVVICYTCCRHHAMLCYAMLCYAMLCYAMLRYAMLCYAMLCYAMLCYAMPRYAMPLHATPCPAMLCRAVFCYTCCRHHAVPCYAMLCYDAATDATSICILPLLLLFALPSSSSSSPRFLPRTFLAGDRGGAATPSTLAAAGSTLGAALGPAPLPFRCCCCSWGLVRLGAMSRNLAALLCCLCAQIILFSVTLFSIFFSSTFLLSS